VIHVGSPNFAAGDEMVLLAPEILTRALARQHDRWPAELHYYSDYQLDRTAKDTALHLEFLTAAVWAGEQSLFTDYLAWCKVRFHGLRTPFDRLTGGLEVICEAVGDCAQPETARLACDMVRVALSEFDALPETFSSCTPPARELVGLELEYLQAVLAGDRRTASRIVQEAFESGTPAEDVYRCFFERTQCELGRMWQSNRISVTQEHIGTEVTRAVMAQLHSYLQTDDKGPYSVIVAGVGAENHGIAAQVVADTFEMAHWKTVNVGANTPIDSILETVSDVCPDVLALSASMANHILDVAAVIRLIRNDPRTAQVCVLVGGYPFNLAPDLWRTVGADGTAATARAGVAVAEQLCA